MTSRPLTTHFLAVALVLGTTLGTGTVAAQTTAQPASQPANPPAPRATVQPATPAAAQPGMASTAQVKPTIDAIYTIPATIKTPEELLAFFAQARQTAEKHYVTPQSTEEELRNLQQKFDEFRVRIADALIALKPEDGTLQHAYLMKLASFTTQAQMDPAKKKDLVALIDTIAKLNKFPDLVTLGNAQVVYIDILDLQSRELEKQTTEDILKMRDTVKTFLTENPDPAFADLALALVDGADAFAAEKKDPEFAVKIREEFAEFLAGLNNPQLGMHIELLVAPTRRAVGKTIEKLEGITVDGKEFDWSAYKGKVVLIDFCGTWCEPWVEEYPNQLKAYETYKDRGFEVVGVGVDDSSLKLAAFMKAKNTPWIVISEEATAEKKMLRPSDYFGVDAMPLMLLLDRNGKIVSDHARGKDLPALIEKALAIPVAPATPATPASDAPVAP